MGIVFSSYIATGFSLGQNFQTSGNSFPLQVPQAMVVNMVAFYFSDRAYDPNPVPFSILDPSGGTVATGSIPAPLRFASQQYYPIQLDRTVTLQANVRYTVAFSSLPAGDTYRVSQDILQEQAPNGYLGQAQWPLFQLGLMGVSDQSQGLAYHNYGAYTDLFSSPGYHVTGEIAMRFQASQNEQLQTLEIYIWSTDGSANQVVFALRPDAGGHPASAAQNIATATLAANQASAGAFAKVTFPNPQLVAGSSYWIVMSSSSGTQPIVFGRLVNPYRQYVLYSTNDFATWGVPPDGPTDLGFRITTTGESVINTVSGSSNNNYFSGAAQSFIPAVSVQVQGAWVGAAPAQGQPMSISIQTDSADSPSGTILAQGSDTISTQFTGGSQPFVYVGFSAPVTLAPGTKYWLVVTAGSASSPARVATLDFRSDYSSSGFAPPSGTHYELRSGAAWVAGPGAINFVLAGGAPPQPTPTTLTLTATAI